MMRASMAAWGEYLNPCGQIGGAAGDCRSIACMHAWMDGWVYVPTLVLMWHVRKSVYQGNVAVDLTAQQARLEVGAFIHTLGDAGSARDASQPDGRC